MYDGDYISYENQLLEQMVGSARALSALGFSSGRTYGGIFMQDGYLTSSERLTSGMSQAERYSLKRDLSDFVHDSLLESLGVYKASYQEPHTSYRP